MQSAGTCNAVDVYGYLIPGSNRNAVNRLDEVNDMPLKVVSAEAVVGLPSYVRGRQIGICLAVSLKVKKTAHGRQERVARIPKLDASERNSSSQYAFPSRVHTKEGPAKHAQYVLGGAYLLRCCRPSRSGTTLSLRIDVDNTRQDLGRQIRDVEVPGAQR